MNAKQAKKLKTIKKQCNLFAEKMVRKMDDLTNELEHVDASNLSNKTQRLKLFISELNEL